MKPTLFYDIDGCLHPQSRPKLNALGKIERHSSDGLFCWNDAFLEILENHADVDLVCHSNWRRHYTFPELLEQLPKDLADRTIDITDPAVDRHKSITMYAQEKMITTYLIMDDDLWAFPNKLPELVWLPEDKGLSIQSSLDLLDLRMSEMKPCTEKKSRLAP